MSTTNTPNMNLIIPGVGTEPGPDYATDVNNSLNIVDRHDHTPGAGVAITPSAININTDLTFAGNFATNIAGATFAPQVATPDPNTIYVNDVDLYFVDGDNNIVQLTINGGVAGTPGSITNLTSPASATYISVSSTFVWQSDVNIAANMDAGSLIMRNLTPNSTFALTLSPPAALGANYILTLPPLPITTSFLTIDTAGAIDPSISTTLGITAGNLATDSVTNSKIQNDAVTTLKILDANVTPAKLSFAAAKAPVIFTYSATTPSSTTAPTGATTCTVIAWGGGGGGGGGAGGNPAAGGGGASGAYLCETMIVVPLETINVVCGAGGTAGAPTSGTGGSGSDTQIDAATSGWILKAPGGTGGTGGSGTSGGAGGDTGAGAAYTYGIGGNGAGNINVTGNSGRRSTHAAAAAGQAGNGNGGGGGAGASGRLAATTAPAGNNGADGAANSAAGGGGGPGSTGGAGQAGGTGGSGYITLIFNSTT